MMLAKLLLHGAVCTQPDLVNHTSFPWNNHDYIMLGNAKKRCETLYKGRSPCLKMFIKTGKQDYKAICGRVND